MISSVNVTKFAGNCGFGHIYWRNSEWKTSFFYRVRVKQFLATGLFLYPLKTSDNQRFPYVLRGYWKRSVAWNGLNNDFPMCCADLNTCIIFYLSFMPCFVYHSNSNYYFALSVQSCLNKQQSKSASFFQSLQLMCVKKCVKTTFWIPRKF